MTKEHGDEGQKDIDQTELKNELSRRKFFNRLLMGVAGGAALMVAGTQRAEAKVSKMSAGYRTAPSKGRRCGICARYQGGGKCSKVAGTVSTSGYCKYYSRRKARGSY